MKIVFSLILFAAPVALALCFGDQATTKKIAEDATLLKEVVYRGQLVGLEQDRHAPLVEIFSEAGRSICTGVSLNSKQVVTSAHCFVGVGKIKYVRVSWRDAQGKPVELIAKQARVHPDYLRDPQNATAPSGAENDIAVIEFKTDQPLATTKIWDGKGTIEELDAYGRGFQSFQDKEVIDEESWGNLIGMPGHKMVKDPQMDFRLRKAPYHFIPDGNERQMMPSGASRVCPGDSGGPLMTSKNEVYALNSRGVMPGTAADKCTKGGMFYVTPIRPHLDFIRGKIKGGDVAFTPIEDEAGQPTIEKPPESDLY